MDSADISGVSERGVSGFTATGMASSLRFSRAFIQIAIVAATLFGVAGLTGFEVFRVIAEFHERLRLTAALTAAEMETVTAPIPAENAFDVIVTDARNAVVSSTLDTIAPGVPFVLETTAPLHAGAEAELSGGMVVATAPYWTLAAPLAQRLGLVLALGALAYVAARRHLPRDRALTDPFAVSFAPALEALPHGLARWTRDGRLICANAAFGQLLRIDSDTLVPGADYHLVSQSHTAARVSVRPVLEAAHRRLLELVRADGSVVTLDERPCPGGGFITLVTDITERKAADRTLKAIRDEQRELAVRYHEEKIRAEAASRAKGAFLAHLSHDIRTPLNHIIGFADLMRLEAFGPLGDDNYRTYLSDIKTSGEKLLGRFAEILEFAELESGSKALSSEAVVLSDFFNAARARHAKRASRAGVRFHVAARVPGTICGDRHYLERMLNNLIDNAIRFTPRGGEVRMVGWAAEDGVVIEITDTGAGMAPETLAQLTQPFVLADPSAAKVHEGVGLGIAMARSIAERSGGRLAIDSMEGVGTTVAICLPLHLGAADRPLEQQAA